MPVRIFEVYKKKFSNFEIYLIFFTKLIFLYIIFRMETRHKEGLRVSAPSQLFVWRSRLAMKSVLRPSPTWLRMLATNSDKLLV